MKMKKILALVVLSVSSAFAAATPAKVVAIAVDSGNSELAFLATGSPSALRINGKGTGPKGKMDVTTTGTVSKLSGQFEIDVTSLESGISMRDKHMKEKYLEVGKFPTSQLAIKDMTLPPALVAGDGSAKVPFTGNLTLHGVTKPISGEADVSRAGSDVKVDSKFKVDLSAFEISIPSFAGITVAKDVEVNVKLKMNAPAKSGK